jgi:hypothetical protein
VEYNSRKVVQVDNGVTWEGHDVPQVIRSSEHEICLETSSRSLAKTTGFWDALFGPNHKSQIQNGNKISESSKSTVVGYGSQLHSLSDITWTHDDSRETCPEIKSLLLEGSIQFGPSCKTQLIDRLNMPAIFD